MFKKRFPKATVPIITNATYPLEGRIREIFEHADDIAISIDGATEDTYERIRGKFWFENAIRNAREIAEMKGGNALIIFVAMDQTKCLTWCGSAPTSALDASGEFQGPDHELCLQFSLGTGRSDMTYLRETWPMLPAASSNITIVTNERLREIERALRWQEVVLSRLIPRSSLRPRRVVCGEDFVEFAELD
jgi:hypothetical protein